MSRALRLEAFSALYAADAMGEAPDQPGISSKALRLATAAWEGRNELDAEIARVATGWRVERMPGVDRAILRLALYELRHTDTPVAVVISEAVEMAKSYSTARSGSFVNGVLAALATATEA